TVTIEKAHEPQPSADLWKLESSLNSRFAFYIHYIELQQKIGREPTQPSFTKLSRTPVFYEQDPFATRAHPQHFQILDLGFRLHHTYFRADSCQRSYVLERNPPEHFRGMGRHDHPNVTPRRVRSIIQAGCDDPELDQCRGGGVC